MLPLERQIDEARRLLSEGRPDLAAAAAEEALAANDHSADAHSLMASILDRRDAWQVSLAHLRRAYELTPAAPQVRLNLALALLRTGNYREGLPLYEARVDKPTWSGFATLQSRAAARQLMLKSGDAVQGRRILLLAEQGLGDGIMFARYIPLLARRGARIALACNPTLRDYFARIPGIETLLSPPADQPLAQINLAALPFDAWLPLLSLAHWFETDAQSIPAARHYWAPEATRIAEWRSKYAAMGRPGAAKVGLVFDCNRAAANHAARSMTVADLLPLFELEIGVGEIDFVNLQHGAGGRELAARAPGVLDPLDADLPLDEYGAAVAATDLLITVDTMAAHLAGAIGHPAWIAVPQSPQWFWGITGEKTPWYESLRIFRQQTLGDWSGVVAALAKALPAKLASCRPVDAHLPATPVERDDGADKSWARFERGVAQLRRGEFADGFANYEARQEIALWREQALPLTESLAEVGDRRLRPGDPVRGRRVLVFTEQGLGDTFFAARFLSVLAERGAAITLVCRAPMRPFFARLPFLDAILSPPDDAAHAKIDLRRIAFDAICPLLSLPNALGVGQRGLAPAAPYLAADPGQTAAWRSRYARAGRTGHCKVGVVWQANPSNQALAQRSMMAEEIAALGRVEKVDLVNLQHGPAGRALSALSPHVIDASREPLSVDEFAAAMAATDLVVSVDTMAAHCAGALGHPVWVALPTVPAFYWGDHGEACAWYPTARLFRQVAPSDWSSVVAAIAATLRNEAPGIRRAAVDRRHEFDLTEGRQ